MLFSFALSLAMVAQQDRSWQTAVVDGKHVKVWGWREGDMVRWVKGEQPTRKENAGGVLDMHPVGPASPPPAPPVAAPSQEDGDAGESSGDLPAYALNGVIESNLPPERVIYTNVPDLAPTLARKYGVRVETDGEPPQAYPAEANATDTVVFPVVAGALLLLALGIKLRQP
jgi:hypothetical protein